MYLLDRIREMMLLAGSADRHFPATMIYNEGWLLRLALDWFSRQARGDHVLNFLPDARWFSEARLPSQFRPRARGDHLAEGGTHADGVIGHVIIGDSALANTKLADNASQFLVTEAKLFSPLSAGTTRATNFDQAARNVACMAEVLSRASRDPDEFASLGFYVLAPSDQISRGIFRQNMSARSIEDKVRERVAGYPAPDHESKEQWLNKWFLPMLRSVKIECISWESLISHMQNFDTEFASHLSEFYSQCRKFNRLEEQERA